MPFQLGIFERRDNGERVAMAQAALAACRAMRQTKGITSARYYWSGSEQIVILVQGEGPALANAASGNPAEFAKASLDLQDHTKTIMNIRLTEPQAEIVTESYRSAGRM